MKTIPLKNKRITLLCAAIGLAFLLTAQAQRAPVVPEPAAELPVSASASPDNLEPVTGLPPLSAQKIQTQIFELPRGNLGEVRDAIQQVLSPEGKVILMPTVRKIFVQDRPAVMENVRAIVAAATAPQPQVRVEVSLVEEGSSSALGAAIQSRSVEQRGGTIRIQPIIKDDLALDASARSGSSSLNQSSFLTVQSGSAASLLVAREVPRALTYFRTWAQSFGIAETTFRWERVGTSLRIEPVVFGNQIQLSLLPQFTNVENQTLVVRELATQLTVTDGVAVQIAGFEKAGSDFNAYFFGFDRERQSNRGTFTLRASILNP